MAVAFAPKQGPGARVGEDEEEGPRPDGLAGV